MPAHRLQSDPISIRKYDVAGQDSESSASFVCHVGLAAEDREDLGGHISEIRVDHMGPPLKTADNMRVDMVGTVDLSVDDQNQIRVFVDERAGEMKAKGARARDQYVIDPHVVPPEHDVPFHRYSCAGFVIEAYKYTGVDVMNTATANLPPVRLETLKEAYPLLAGLLDDRDKREKYGLEGEPPWHVVLAGYVINSLDRTSDEIRSTPYQPQPGDEFFRPK